MRRVILASVLPFLAFMASAENESSNNTKQISYARRVELECLRQANAYSWVIGVRQEGFLSKEQTYNNLAGQLKELNIDTPAYRNWIRTVTDYVYSNNSIFFVDPNDALSAYYAQCLTTPKDFIVDQDKLK